MVEKAEKAIRQTQPTFEATDKSEILNNPIFKELTMFASQRSKLVNMSVRAVDKISRGNVADGLADLAYVSIFVSSAITAIKGIWKKLKGDDEDKEMKDHVKDIAASYASNLPVAGMALESVITGKQMRAPGVIMGDMQTAVNLVKALKSGDEEKIQKAAMKTLQATGVPVAGGEVFEVGANILGGGN